MSHYYGTLQGSRGEATRQGHKSSGIRTNTACWSGTIFTRLWYNEETEEDCEPDEAMCDPCATSSCPGCDDCVKACLMPM